MESELDLRRSVQDLEASHGPRSIEVGRRLHELARLLASGTALIADGDGYGRRQEADALYDRALAIKRGALGHDDPEVAVTLHDWALLCQAAGEHQRARALWEAAEALLAGRRPETHKSNNTRGN